MKTVSFAMLLVCCSCVGSVDTIETISASLPAEDVGVNTEEINFYPLPIVYCNDENECTKDALLASGKCVHFNYTNLQSCGRDSGRCNGNVTPAECCLGCMMFVGDSVECRSACPLAQTCGPDGFCH